MFFLLSKLLDVAVDPLWWVLGLMGAGLLLLLRGPERRRPWGLRLISAGLAVLLVASLPAVSNRLWASLEDFPSTARDDVTYDVVVLLGGAVSPQGSTVTAPGWNDNVDRLLTTHHLLQSGRAKKALVTGGALGGGLKTEAEYLAAELIRLGVDPARVIVEPQANNTRENATYSKPLLEAAQAREVLLVTSAFHLSRAVGCFRAVGLTADALAVDYRMRDPRADPHLLPRVDYLSQTGRALREWLGRAVYAVMGYTK